MQTLNLVRPEESTIKYSISRFPDGEVQIKLDEIDRKKNVLVKCRVTTPEELFLLLQVGDILDRQEVVYDVYIYYLMGMRMDRVMDFNRPYTLKIVINMLNSMKNANTIAVYNPHSDKHYDLSDHVYPIVPADGYYHHIDGDFIMVLPDQGAIDRFERYGTYDASRTNVVKCNKVRDPETGQLKGFKVLNPEVVENADKPLVIIDDLCDGGGTFAGIAAEIRKINPNVELSISVSHMVNPKGIKTLSENFNKVYFTNSYKDWENLPENCEMRKVI